MRSLLLDYGIKENIISFFAYSTDSCRINLIIFLNRLQNRPNRFNLSINVVRFTNPSENESHYRQSMNACQLHSQKRSSGLITHNHTALSHQTLCFLEVEADIDLISVDKCKVKWLIRAQCFQRLGCWSKQQRDTIGDSSPTEILLCHLCDSDSEQPIMQLMASIKLLLPTFALCSNISNVTALPSGGRARAAQMVE